MEPFPGKAKADDPRIQARNALHRHLGNPTGQASAMVAELTDAEVEQIVAAETDKQTARAQIKALLSAAYDRRSAAHAEEARQRTTALRRNAAAARAKARGEESPPAESESDLTEIDADEPTELASAEGEAADPSSPHEPPAAETAEADPVEEVPTDEEPVADEPTAKPKKRKAKA